MNKSKRCQKRARNWSSPGIQILVSVTTTTLATTLTIWLWTRDLCLTSPRLSLRSMRRSRVNKKASKLHQSSWLPLIKKYLYSIVGLSLAPFWAWNLTWPKDIPSKNSFNLANLPLSQKAFEMKILSSCPKWMQASTTTWCYRFKMRGMNLNSSWQDAPTRWVRVWNTRFGS